METPRWSVMVTGGCGYIGSHVVGELCRAAIEKSMVLPRVLEEIVVVDDLSNGYRQSIDRILEKQSSTTRVKIFFYKCRLQNREQLREVFRRHPLIRVVIHLAGSKSVPDSVSRPLEYYDNNVSAAVTLLQAMQDSLVTNIVFSSSATVYGTGRPSSDRGFAETDVTCPNNVYGKTKQIIETMLQDLCRSDSAWTAVALRYFNPVGADLEFDIGEHPAPSSTNLIPTLLRCIGESHYTRASATEQKLQHTKTVFTVYGTDGQTPDGSGIRDYVHVKDLARGHVSVLQRMVLDNRESCKSETEDNEPDVSGCSSTLVGFRVFNLGSGQKNSVLQIVDCFASQPGSTFSRDVEVVVGPPRVGDARESLADVTLAVRELGWECQHSVQDMCRDAWQWFLNNPRGYAAESTDP